MTDELVSRLRTVAAGQTWVVAETACNEAADELEARARRIAELERALRDAIYEVTHLSERHSDGRYRPIIHSRNVDGWRAALTAHKGNDNG